MSAYALPGSLFPPLGSSMAEVTNTSPSHLRGHEDESRAKIDAQMQSVKLRKQLTKVSTERDDGHGMPKEVGIAVKQAKLDPVRLAQSSSNSKTASSRYPDKRISKRRLKSSDSQGESESNCQPSSCRTSLHHEDAIQFELSISFNGRSYVATRTLPCIVQLRNDIIRELNAQRKKLQRRRLRWGQVDSKCHEESSLHDDAVVLVSDKDLEELIPQVPDCDTREGTGGFAARGFTMLHALLRSYCPAMERWLCQVADLVPPNSSPSLTRFLWEPLAVEDPSFRRRVGRFRTSSSLSCILEDESSDGEGDCDVGNGYSTI